jgi:hypothetical protein
MAALGELIAVVLLAIVMLRLGAGLAHVAIVAVELGAETASFILEASDLAYQEFPQVRGMVMLLAVGAAIKTLRRRD